VAAAAARGDQGRLTFSFIGGLGGHAWLKRAMAAMLAAWEPVRGDGVSGRGVACNVTGGSDSDLLSKPILWRRRLLGVTSVAAAAWQLSRTKAVAAYSVTWLQYWCRGSTPRGGRRLAARLFSLGVTCDLKPGGWKAPPMVTHLSAAQLSKRSLCRH